MRLLRSGLFWFTLVTAVLLVSGVWLSWCYWEDLHSNQESLSTTLRNLGLLIGGAITLVFAVWRGLVAERQAEAARRQADTAQQSLLNERYQRGAEMLGNEVLSVRLGGIYALQRLAEEHPEQYHIQIMDLLCAFVRHPTKSEEDEANQVDSAIQPDRGDIQTALEAISARHEAQLDLENNMKFRLHLQNADLSRLDLRYLNLSHAVLIGANLSDSYLNNANLSDTSLDQAKLCRTKLWDAILTEVGMDDTILTKANLAGANVSGARLYAKGLTQTQLDSAWADTKNPPRLINTFDAETGEQLVWRGKPLDERT